MIIKMQKYSFALIDKAIQDIIFLKNNIKLIEIRLNYTHFIRQDYKSREKYS